MLRGDLMKIDLRRQRYEVGLTMAEVAKKVGVSEATVSRWESGDIKNMKRDKIVLLANALNVSPALLMDWDVPTSSAGDVQESEITQLCQKLSDTDRNKVIGFINGLLSSETYTKNLKKIFRAARSTDGTPPEIIDRDDALMDKLKKAPKVTSDEDL